MSFSTAAIESELFPSDCFFDDIAVTVSVANPESLLILSSFPSYSSADSITSDSSVTGKVTSLLQVGAANPMLRGKSDAARASLTGYESAPPPSLELVWRRRPFTILFLGTGEGKGLVSTLYAACASATIVARQSDRSILVNCIPSTKISWGALFSWKRDYLPQGLEVGSC